MSLVSNVLDEIAPRVKMLLTIWSLVYKMSLVKMFEYKLESPSKNVIYEMTPSFHPRIKMSQHFAVENIA
jgi:hypothetical protein